MKLRRGRFCAMVGAAALCGRSPVANATDFAWLGSSNTLWSNSGNWNPIGIPSNNDNAQIYEYAPTGNFSLTVNYDSTATPASINNLKLSVDSDGTLTTNVATLNLLSGTLNVAHEYVGIFNAGSAFTAEYGNGVVNQSGGTHNVGSLTIGDQQNFVAGAYNLSGAATLNVTSIEQIGYPLLGNGSFTQSGGTHTAAKLNVSGGYDFSAGTLSATAISIGGGTFSQTGGTAAIGSLALGGSITGPFGANIPTPGTAALSAGSLTASSFIYVGIGSDGTLLIGGTAKVTTPELENFSDVEVSGGILSFGMLVNQGTFSWTGGEIAVQAGTSFDSLASASTIGGLFNTGLSLTSGRTLAISGTETLGGLGSFTLNIPTNGSNIAKQLNISSKGKLNLTGGALTCTAINLVGQNQLFNWTAGTLNLLNSVTLDPNASTLTTGSIFGGTLALNNRALTTTAETLTSTIRTQTFALSVGTNGNNLVSGALTVGSLGSLTIGGGTVQAGSTIVASGGKLLFSSGAFSPGSFSVTGSGVATFSAASPTIVCNTLSVDNTAKLDIGTSRLIVHNGDSNALRGSLFTGYDAGAWDGNGIRSSNVAAGSKLAIGYLLNNTGNGGAFYTSFGGVPVISTDTLIQSTYIGDANLDGKVNVVDLGLLASHWQQGGYWAEGDFNYDGKVDVVDLGSLASNWQAGVTAGGMSFDAALESVGLGNVAVPEPNIVAAAVCLLSLFRRRVA